MYSEVILVVGDEYYSASNFNDVITVKELRNLLKVESNFDQLEKIIIGLGVNESERKFIEKEVTNNFGIEIITTNKKAESSLTHKIDIENNLISTPIAKNNEYIFDFLVDNKVDRLSDHVTGVHVGAMLLMEAARQATISALELDYCTPDNTKYGLALKTFESNFHDYTFPVPTIIKTKTFLNKESISKYKEIKVISSFQQNGKEVAIVTLFVTLIPNDKLTSIEFKKFEKSKNLLISKHTKSNNNRVIDYA